MEDQRRNMAGQEDSSSESSTFDFESNSASETESESGRSSGGDEDVEELGARPYMYEPEGESDSGSDGSGSDEENEERLGNNDWCTCEQCQAMVTARECVCCREIDAVRNMTDTFVLDLDCIVDHPGFRTVCLDRWVLDTAYMQYRQQYGGRAQDGIENKKYRHTAYRQLARWCWGYLGRNVRVLLPACAVRLIRETFPSADGQYKGFSEVLD